MVLSLKSKIELKNYVVDSLVERFNFSKEAAILLVLENGVIEDIENNPEKAMKFDAEFIAEKLVAKSRLN